MFSEKWRNPLKSSACNCVHVGTSMKMQNKKRRLNEKSTSTNRNKGGGGNVEIKTNLKLETFICQERFVVVVISKEIKRYLYIKARYPEKNNLFHRRTGPLHIGGGGGNIFWPVLPIPRQPWKLRWAGREGGLVHFIFAPEICSIYSNTELGVHEIPQVLAARILDKQKTKQKQLPGFCPNSYIGTVPPPPFSYAYDLF